jgi:hypothetical protein
MGLTEEGVIPPQIAIEGRMAEISFSRGSGFCGSEPGEHPRAGRHYARIDVPVSVTFISRASNEVTMAVR